MTLVISITDELHRAKESAVARFLLARERRAPRLGGQWRSTAAPEKNLRGIGIGVKRKNRRKTQRFAIQFFVAHKYPDRSVSPEDRIPPEWDGSPTDVVEIGDVFPIGLRDRLRPAESGCSIGALQGIDATLGTLGAVVRHREAPERLAILSCSHVLTNWERFPPGSPINQPAPVDGGTEAADAIARVVRVAPLVQDRRGRFDAALADVLDPTLVAPPFHGAPQILDPRPIPPVQEMMVHKLGMATELTYGTAFSVGTAIEINTQDPDIGSVLLEDQFFIKDRGKAFSDYGDSGSLVFSTERRQPCGLLVARSSSGFSVANRLSSLLDFFEVDIAR